MFSGIENLNSTVVYAQSYSVKNQGAKPEQKSGSLYSFEEEDKAIISAQAKLLNEIEKYNSGESDEIKLALTSIESKNQVKVAAKVIKSKIEAFDSILEII